MKTQKPHYKAVCISDIHLGTAECQAEKLDAFLHSITCDELYLVGDIIDVWAMSRGKPQFPQAHVNVIRRFLSMARKGTKVKYVIGNHDEFFRGYLDTLQGVDFGNIEFADEFIFDEGTSKILVIHGDLYDNIVKYHRWICHIGDVLYSVLLKINRYYNKWRAWRGKPYWSLSAYLKYQVKHARVFIEAFEGALAKAAREKDCNAVICGHIHYAEKKYIGDILYMNDGDWVESCTALVYKDDNTWEILRL